MEALFLKALYMSWSAGWLVLAVLLLRLVLQKAPKWVNCVLWALVALRLVCPISPESSFSLIPQTDPLAGIYAQMPEAASAPEEAILSAADAEPGEILYAWSEPAGQEQEEAYGEIYVAVSSAGRSMTVAGPVDPVHWQTVGACLWGLGIAAMLLYALGSYWRIRQKVAPSIPAGRDVLLCDYIDTPFILGIFRPKIYLPSALPADSFAYVLAHERAHLRRRDHLWKPFGFLLLSLYWFHPLLWLAYVLLCRDIELACDERVIREMDLEEKKAYSEALLRCSIPRRIISACPLAFGEVSVKERVRAVLHYRKPGFWIILISIVLCIVLAVCFLTDPYSTTLSQLVNVSREDVDTAYLSNASASTVLSVQRETEALWALLDEISCAPETHHEMHFDTLDALDFARFHIVKFYTGNEEAAILYFSLSEGIAWVLDGDQILLGYRIHDTRALEDFFDTWVKPVYQLEATAAPFASAEEPYRWTSGITLDAVCEAEQWTCRYNLYSSTFLPRMRFQELLTHLNALPEEAFGPGEPFEDSPSDSFATMEVQEANTGVVIRDGSNGITASVRYYKLDTGEEILDLLLTAELDLNSTPISIHTPCTRWEIRDEALLAFMRELYTNPPATRVSLASWLQWAEEPTEVSGCGASIRTLEASGWVYETVPYTEGCASFGIRCRPKTVEKGWLYFSFWPEGCHPEEEYRDYDTWSSSWKLEFDDGITGYLGKYSTFTDQIWSFQKQCTSIGDFAIIRSFSSKDFKQFREEIQRVMGKFLFSGGDPVPASLS